MHGAGYKSSRSFATKFLTGATERVVQLFSAYPTCWLCVFWAPDGKQIGRMVVHIVQETVDHQEIEFPAPNYFAFTGPQFVAFGSDDGSLPYLIYAEYLDQKGLLAA